MGVLRLAQFIGRRAEFEQRCVGVEIEEVTHGIVRSCRPRLGVRSRGWKKGQRTIGYATGQNESTEKFSKAREVRVREAIVQPGEVLEATLARNTRRDRRLRRQLPYMRQAPVA